MNEIHVLDKATIDKIAAGEVVDRPSSIVKELCENSIDAGATSISVEITDGGTKLVRITDNGRGISAGQVRLAFLRHSTSKINDASELSFIKTLGFRGEALSSIAAVSRLELFTKTRDALTGSIYKMEGGEEICFEEAGLPDGTTLLVKDLFFNTPARLKFLKTAKTEAGYISDIIEKIALSHPDISFKFKSNNSLKLSTTGNGKLKDAIYAVYGRDIAGRLIEVEGTDGLLTVKGFLGDPVIARGSRNFETYFINGRYIRDRVIESAIEEAYKGYQMKGTFPFTVFDVQIEPELIDVNVHPSKMEIRFYDNEAVFRSVSKILSRAIRGRENIPVVQPGKQEAAKGPELPDKNEVPEPFETHRTAEFLKKYTDRKASSSFVGNNEKYHAEGVGHVREEIKYKAEAAACVREKMEKAPAASMNEQETLFNDRFLSEKARACHRVIGEVFDTYWIVEYADQIYFIDQHAAHEKVLYEEFMERIRSGERPSQNILPQMILTLDHRQEAALSRFLDAFSSLGFVIEPFGEKDYAVSALPMDLYGLNSSEKFLLMLDELTEARGSFSPETLLDKVATASCKAAVKGGNRLSFAEADTLIDKLLQLENPYNCPHGRPTIITMTKSELERKFKRQI